MFVYTYIHAFFTLTHTFCGCPKDFGSWSTLKTNNILRDVISGTLASPGDKRSANRKISRASHSET